MKTLLSIVFLGAMLPLYAQTAFSSDVIETRKGPLEMTFIGHGTLMFTWNDLVIHIDPVMREADYSLLPDADLVLVSHQHGDHLDMTAIGHVRQEGTRVVMTQSCMEQLEDVDATLMANGDRLKIHDIGIKALPAYNIEHKRSSGKPFHPKGEGNAYLLDFSGTRVLIGGDTENVPELRALDGIDVAFLPMNLPYTMTPVMVADLAVAMQPAILYPYHYGNTDPGELVELLKNEKGIEVRVRELR